MISWIKNSVLFLAFILGTTHKADGQVCSAIGQLCTRTTDCCRGCCEAFQCVERNFPCSSDMGSIPGSNGCDKFFCPSGQICFLAPVCRPENPCPPQPTCRPFSGPGYGNYYNSWRNSSQNVRPPCWILVPSFVLARFAYAFRSLV